jgi:intracellular protein transport protein USO1
MAETEAQRIQRRGEAEMADLRATNSRLEVEVMKANKSKAQELAATRDSLNAKVADQVAATIEAEERAQLAEKKIEEVKGRLAEVEKLLEAAEEARRAAEAKTTTVEGTLKKSEALVKTREEEKAATQSELDDLLMVFGDLEEKAGRYKVRNFSIQGVVETSANT